MSTPQDPRSGDFLAVSSPAGWPGGFAPPATVARPGTVVAAVVVWVLAGVLLLGYGATILATVRDPAAKDALLDLLAQSQVQVSDAILERVLIGLGAVGLVLGLLTVVFGMLLLRGVNWARILVTVVGVLGTPFVLFLFPLVLLAIVLQFLPSSNVWFRSRVAARVGQQNQGKPSGALE